jgi:cell division protein FtsB
MPVKNFLVRFSFNTVLVLLDFLFAFTCTLGKKSSVTYIKTALPSLGEP